MSVTWSQTSNPRGARYASVDGFVFAMVMLGQGTWHPRWMVALYPSGQTSETRSVYVGSEAQAKRFIERWTAAHSGQIGRPPRPPKRTY